MHDLIALSPTFDPVLKRWRSSTPIARWLVRDALGGRKSWKKRYSKSRILEQSANRDYRLSGKDDREEQHDAVNLVQCASP